MLFNIQELFEYDNKNMTKWDRWFIINTEAMTKVLEPIQLIKISTVLILITGIMLILIDWKF